MNKIITQNLKKHNRQTAYNVLYLLVTFLLILNSCAPEPVDELNKKINIALRNDNKIDETEWTEFIEYAKKNEQEFPELIIDGKIKTETLNELILNISSRRRNNTEPPEIFNPEKKETVFEKAKVKVFIENSGSMDGYVRGITDFEITIGKLLVLSKDYSSKNNFNINFINKKVYPAPEIEELTDFAKALEPKQGSPYYDKGGKARNESILNDVIKHLLDSTNINDISILVSDCIYSLTTTKDTKGSLGYQQNGTMEAFLNKFDLQPNIVTAIFKMTSNYDGKYYPYNYKRSLNNSIDLSKQGIKRPYYIWIIGSDKHITPFLKKVKVESLKGFENSYYLSNSSENKQPYFTVLKETNKIGKYRPLDKSKKFTEMRGIQKVEFEDRTLRFAIAIDLDNIPVDQSYLTNPANYIVPDGFTIKSIVKVDRNKISKRDFITIEKTTATHIITVSTTNEFSIQDLQMELSNKIPDWVEKSNSIDDRDISSELNKTFGLLYLVKGVSEAYTTQNPNNKSYFKINIIIKK
jgi:hypothetical protein